MKTMLAGFLTLLAIIVATLLGISAISAIAIGLGWLLTQIVPNFTLFEATIVMILTTIITIIVLSRTITFFMELGEAPTPVMSQFEDDSNVTIPSKRFADTLDEFDGEAYLRYHVANAIFDDLDALPRTVGLKNEKQIVELAIRLTTPVFNILKRRRKRASRITISVTAMKKEMDRMGLRPYDNDILETAVSSVNNLLEVDNRLVEIINDDEWDELLWF